MASPHTIRLRGLWGYEVLEDRSPSNAPAKSLSGTLRLPADWSAVLGAEFRGRVRCRRTFNWPSQLQPHERVWLILAGAGVCQATLNNQPLGAAEIQLPARLEITARLASHNELLVDSNCDAGGVPLGEVRLEISSDSGSALDASLE